MWSVARLHLLLLLSYVASQSLVFYDNLPDGMNEVLVSHYGGLLITGFDSRRRVCLVLFTRHLAAAARSSRAAIP